MIGQQVVRIIISALNEKSIEFNQTVKSYSFHYDMTFILYIGQLFRCFDTLNMFIIALFLDML